MLIPLPFILSRYNFKPKGVIQVGAHWAEEHEVFVSLEIKNIVYIEPCKGAFDKLLERFEWEDDILLFNSACSDTVGEMNMFTSNDNQGQSNSLLSPHLHLSQHPEVVFSTTEKVRVNTLDNLMKFATLQGINGNFELLLMDCQGAEGLVLKGAKETLSNIKMIYTECNRGQTYEGNMEIEEMDAFLFSFGFSRVETYWPSPNWTWGDCVYVHKSLL